MLGSLSHLSSQGIVSYTEDLVRFWSSLEARVGPRVEAGPCVPVPLGDRLSGAC
jgi:hypothetical protein